MKDLNNIIPANSGWDLQSANSISDSDKIAGGGIFSWSRPRVPADSAVTGFRLSSLAAVAENGGRPGRFVRDPMHEAASPQKFFPISQIGSPIFAYLIRDKLILTRAHYQDTPAHYKETCSDH